MDHHCGTCDPHPCVVGLSTEIGQQQLHRAPPHLLCCCCWEGELVPPWAQGFADCISSSVLVGGHTLKDSSCSCQELPLSAADQLFKNVIVGWNRMCQGSTSSSSECQEAQLQKLPVQQTARSDLLNHNVFGIVVDKLHLF